MAELNNRELRQIGFCAKLSQAAVERRAIWFAPQELPQILADIRSIAKERNLLEDEVINLSSLLIDKAHDNGLGTEASNQASG